MPHSKEQVSAAPLRVDGVSDLDPEGRIPLDKLINGTTVIIPRWPRFPGPQQPGDPVEPYTDLYLYWLQDGTETELYRRRYTFVDDRPEFEFALTPEMLKDDGDASIRYLLEGYDGNVDPSPSRRLTIDHTVPQSLEKPLFPDVNLWNYLNCSTVPFIGERIRIEIEPEKLFQAFDVCELEWQGFDSLNGSPPALTPLHIFKKTLTATDASNGFVLDIDFDPFIRPMFKNHSGTAKYTLLRGGVPLARSGTAMVRIDRVRPGEPVPCGD